MLALIAGLRKAGYATEGLAPDLSLAKLCSIYDYSEILSMPILDADKAIDTLSRIVESIEKEKHPEFLIVKMAKGVFPYSEMIPGTYGLPTWLVSQTVSPNYVITCSTLDLLNRQVWESIDEGLYKKLDYHTDIVCASNLTFDGSASFQDKALHFLHDTEAHVQEKLQKDDNWIISESTRNGIMVMNPYNAKHIEFLIKNIVKRRNSCLASYSIT